MNYNPSNDSNPAFIFSQTKTKEIPSALFPIMSTGFSTYAPYQSGDIMTNINNSYLFQPSSPPPIPRFILDNSQSVLSGSIERFEESDSQKEGRTIANNCSLSRLQRDNFDSTSGREEWTEELLLKVAENGGTSGPTRHAATDTDVQDQISASNTSHCDDDKLSFDCIGHVDTVVTICLAIVSFATPILMALLPRFAVFGWPTLTCSTACEFTIMFIAFKLCILSIASLVLFFRRQTYSFPRVLIFKLVLIMLLFFIIFTFWLFYVLRILLVGDKKSVADYDNIVSFSSSVTDILLFMHYLAIVMLEIRHLDSRFCIKIVRSPDGESRFYKVGNISIQAAAVKILQNYVLDFPMYNIYSRSANRTSLSRDSNAEILPLTVKAKSHTIHCEPSDEKIHSGDKDHPSPLRRSTRSLGQSPRNSRHGKFPRSLTQSDIGFSGFKERLYKEMEHEKRLKKRRLRLMASGEDIFNRVKRRSVYEEDSRNWKENEASAKVLTVSETAQNILAQLAKPFQKYLKLSRLQPHFPKMRILNHLVKCLQFGMSAQAFLENFIVTPRVIESSECIHGQVWTVVCNQSLCRGLCNNMTFLLKRQGVSLMCSIYHIPIFSLSEDICDMRSQEFVIKFNSETSV